MIDIPTDRLVLDYVNVENYVHLKAFVKSFVHRSCYAAWNLKEEYSAAVFELIVSAIDRGHFPHSIYAKSGIQVLNLKSTNEISVMDHSTIFGMQISRDDVIAFCDQGSAFLENGADSFRFGKWEFEFGPNDQILIKEYGGENAEDILLMPANRFLEMLEAIYISVSQQEAKPE